MPEVANINMILTAHATEQAVVRGWHSDVCMVVTIETYPKAEGCLHNDKLSTQINLHSTDGGDRWNDHCPIDLKSQTDQFLYRQQT